MSRRRRRTAGTVAGAAVEAETGLIAGLNHDGAGVVRGAKAAFVAGALPGETVRFVRRLRHRQHDEADLLEVLEASPDRVEPRCAHFGICGGCALQHLSPAAQLAAKQAELAEALQRIGKVAPAAWFEPLSGPQWGYRRRARLGAKYVTKRERVLVGFRERQKPYVAALARCEILAAPVGELIEPLSALLTGLAAREAIPQIEVAIGDEVTALVFRVLADLGADDLAALARFEAERGVRVYVQRGGLDSVQPLVPPAPRLGYALPRFDLRLEFEPVDFIQVNGELNRDLVGRAVDLLGCGPGDRVLDLFCGLGNFTLPIARTGATVVGVEGEAGLVARARQNAVANGIDTASFFTANLAAPEAATSPWMAGPYTHVLLDPPRAGALEMLPTVAALRPARIVYVSCHPGSLARDLGVLCEEHGYRLAGAGVVDMFPHTTHVESIAVLERPAGRGRRCDGEPSMGIEIERKFLLSSDGWRTAVRERTLLRQGYLANNERCSVRVRVAGGDAGWLCVKAMTPGLARAEYEYPLPLAEANAMLDALCGRPFIEKWRHVVPWRGHDWEIDEFLGDNAGLVVAEVELDRVDEVPEMPPWIGREVTQDVRFYNFSLVELPWPAFRDAWLRGEPATPMHPEKP